MNGAHVAMFWFRAPGQCIQAHAFISEGWGDSMRYVEVGDDQHATRQVEQFANGNMLRYDRTHWCDDYAMLLPIMFSRKAKWRSFFPGAEDVTAAEFESIWQQSKQSPLWREQIQRSHANEYGTGPWWLPHNG